MAEETVQINLSRLQLKLVELQKIWESICTSAKAKKIFADGIPPLIITSQQIAIPSHNLTSAQQDFINKTIMEDEIKKVENSDEFKMNSISDMWRGKTPIHFGKRGNEFVILNNKEEDPDGYDEIIHQLSAFNGTLSLLEQVPEIEFDIIIGVFLHGNYEEKYDPSPEMMAKGNSIGEQVQLDMYGKVKTVKQGMYPVRVPSDLKPTFLDAVLCGITNIAHFKVIRERIREILPYMIRNRHIDMQVLKSELQKIKEEVAASPIFAAEMRTDSTDDYERFRHHAGWNIITGRFLDKGYVKDDKVFGTPAITVFYSKPGTQIPTEKQNVLDDILLGLKKTHMNIRGQQIEIYRSELVDYLYKCGYRNPLIIDTSCGDVAGLDSRGSRKIVAEQLKTQTAGKKRSRKKMQKRTRRTKL